ncbi:MAG: hypothetical protein WC460_03205 [Patescibacteria group bacterium]
MPFVESPLSKGMRRHIRRQKAADRKAGKPGKNYRPDFYDFPLSVNCPTCQSSFEDSHPFIKKTIQGSKKIRRCKKCKTFYRTTGKEAGSKGLANSRISVQLNLPDYYEIPSAYEGGYGWSCPHCGQITRVKSKITIDTKQGKRDVYKCQSCKNISR